jgi:hypothetical protein
MDTHQTKYLLTTKFTKDTKASELYTLTFVLFVSFVVKSVFCGFAPLTTYMNSLGSAITPFTAVAAATAGLPR